MEPMTSLESAVRTLDESSSMNVSCRSSSLARRRARTSCSSMVRVFFREKLRLAISMRRVGLLWGIRCMRRQSRAPADSWADGVRVGCCGVCAMFVGSQEFQLTGWADGLRVGCCMAGALLGGSPELQDGLMV